MARLPAVLRRGTDDRTAAPPADEGPPGLGSALRKALMALGILLVVYLVSRRTGSTTPAQSVDRAYEPAATATRGGPHEEPVGSVGGGTDEGGPGVERSTEEMAELAESDVRSEPMEPGEMTVDEEVIEDVVDEAEAGEDAGETGE